jgi:ribosomal protein L40E
VVKKMVYCSNCGEKIDDNAYFCPKCGTKTSAGKASNAAYPVDELRDAFYKVGIELERAFNIAARETQAAFKKASENMHQKTVSNYDTPQGSVVCTSCGANNISGAVFCHSCGTKVGFTESSSGST